MRRAQSRCSLPHVRGGVSDPMNRAFRTTKSSPRAWGCFQHWRPSRHDEWVFPTCVGVFPPARTPTRRGTRLPHVRGGVSVGYNPILCGDWSSPRAWGCFLYSGCSRPAKTVFPTCVGVFPAFAWAPEPYRRLPHVRGGVSQQRLGIAQQQASSPRAWGCFQK